MRTPRADQAPAHVPHIERARRGERGSELQLRMAPGGAGFGWSEDEWWDVLGIVGELKRWSLSSVLKVTMSDFTYVSVFLSRLVDSRWIQ